MATSPHFSASRPTPPPSARGPASDTLTTKAWSTTSRLRRRWSPSRALGLAALLLPVFIVVAAFQAGAEDGWATLLYSDFDSGEAPLWNLETGWQVELAGANYVLSGPSGRWARPKNRVDWSDYELTFRLRLVQGGVHIHFRTGGVGGYFVSFGEHGGQLRREAPPGVFEDIDGFSATHDLGVWRTIRLRVEGDNARFHVDDVLLIDQTDTSPLALQRGGIAFQVLDGSRAEFDEVLVDGEPVPSGFMWEKLGGPLGGLGYDVRITPSNTDVMYVTDNYAGVARSVDGGRLWTESNEGITARAGPSGDAIPIFCLTIDPHDHSTVWAGALGVRGVFKSTDAGMTWTQKDNGIVEAGGITLRSFTIDPRDPNTVYCGAEIETGERGLEFARQKGKIYRTLDGGENWSSIWAGDSLVRHIIVDPTDSDIIYAATGIFDREAYNSDVANSIPGGLGVLKSANGGTSWTAINNGLSALYVGYLAMDPTDRLTLYAATGMYSAARKGTPGGLYVTRDGGQSWQLLIYDDYEPLTAVRVSPTSPSIRYAGSAEKVWRSEDSGQTWTGYGKGDGTYGPPGVRAGIPIDLTIDPHDPLHVYVNNYKGGVFQSYDGGETWIESSRGYTGAQINDLAAAPTSPSVVYAIGRTGPFRSDDGGRMWEGLRYPDNASIVEWYAIEAAPDDASKVLATGEGAGVILLSVNAGTSWTEVFRHPGDLGEPDDRHGFKAVRFAPTDSSVVYAGMCRNRDHIDAGGNEPSYGVHVSRDGGQTWIERNEGLRQTSALNVHDIAVHPTNPSTAYVATHDSGVFRTTDYGASWSPTSGGLDATTPAVSIRALAIDPHDPQRVYAGVEQGGVYLSEDGGTSWSNISAGMDPWASIRSIAVNPLIEGFVVVGDWHSGVYFTETGTQPWQASNHDLSTRAVTSLLHSAGADLLYAGTDGGGVFRARGRGGWRPSAHWMIR